MSSPISGIPVPIVNRPFLKWKGLDVIGQQAKIEGDPDQGFVVQFFNDEAQRWQSPQDVDQYRWVLEGFLAEMMDRGERHTPTPELLPTIETALALAEACVELDMDGDFQEHGLPLPSEIAKNLRALTQGEENPNA